MKNKIISIPQTKPLVVKHNGTTRVMYMRKRTLKEKFNSFVRKVVHYIRVMLWSTAIIGWAAFAGAIFVKETMPAEVKSMEKVVMVENNELPPVLVRIAQAESYNSHYCTEKLIKLHACKKSELGQVLVHVNSDNSIDVEKFMINVTRHGSELTRMGLNVYNEKDNEAYARHLYAKNGSADWEASKSKWRK